MCGKVQYFESLPRDRTMLSLSSFISHELPFPPLLNAIIMLMVLNSLQLTIVVLIVIITRKLSYCLSNES